MSEHPTNDELLNEAIDISQLEAEEAADDTADKVRLDDEELAPIEMAAEDASHAGKSMIQAFGTPTRQPHDEKWTRQPNLTGQGAIHVKTFVAKLRLDAIEHLDEQVNEWLDLHPEYEVKQVTTSIGKLVGKNTEDAIFMNVWV